MNSIAGDLPIFPLAHITLAFDRFPIPASILFAVSPFPRIILSVAPEEFSFPRPDSLLKLPFILAHFTHLDSSLFAIRRPYALKIRLIRKKNSLAMLLVVFSFAEIESGLPIRLILNYLKRVSFNKLLNFNLIKFWYIIFNKV